MKEFFLETLQIQYTLRILLAGICGIIIGLERKNRSKEAGIRTHFVVACGAALMMVVSKYGFFDIIKEGVFSGADVRLDPSRIASTIASGIGFLGAGMIFVHRNIITGLTTAAGIWATSGVGMAIGAGMYIIGVVTTVIIFVFQILFHKKFKFLLHQNTENMSFVVRDSANALSTVREIMKEEKLSYSVVSLRKIKDDRMQIDICVSFLEDFDMLEFIEKIAENEEIESVYTE